MTLRLRGLLGPGLAGFAVAFAGGCSSSSSGDAGAPGDASAPASSEDAGDAGAPVMDAPAAVMCDAVSLAPAVDAGAAACFECQAASCMAEVAACSIDCTCAPAYTCLEQNAPPGALNSGYSACTAAVDALMNGDVALMDVAHCATLMCSAPCFGDGG